MKKLAFLLLAMLLVLSMTACDMVEDTTSTLSAIVEETEQEQNTEETNKMEDSTEAITEETEEEHSAVGAESIAEQVVYDKDGIVITVTGLEKDIWSSKIKMQLQNDSAKNVTVQVLDFTVNDLVVDPLFSCDVAAGKKANDTVEIYASELDINGIQVIMDIEFRFNIFDTDTWDTVDDTVTVKLETSEAGKTEQVYDDSGAVVYEGNGIKMVAKTLEVEGSWLGSELYMYIENESDKNIMITIENTSVNGYMVDPFFYSEIPAGKKAYDSITFTDTDLEENGITSIESFEGVFTISDAESWNVIATTDVVSLSFTE